MIQSQAIRSFHDALREGQRGEEILDKFFSRWYDIAFASAEEEQVGIDRIFTTNSPKIVKRTVEYKTDFFAAKTGNAYIETLSRSDKNILGWLHTSKAEWLIYFAYPKQVFIFEFEVLREFLRSTAYSERSVKNKGYYGSGLIIPLIQLKNVARKVLEYSIDE